MKLHLRHVVVLALSLLCSISGTAATRWQTIAPGIDYTQITESAQFPDGKLHAFRIDPRQYAFTLGLTQATNSTTTPVPSIVDLMQQQHALIAVNGGFFSPDGKPLGLRISAGKILNPLRNISWWGVFYLHNTQAHIVAKKDFLATTPIDFAIQSGPRLIVDGQVPHLSDGIDDRSALGITRDGKIILLASAGILLSTTQLADIMRRPAEEDGLDCTQAINLDGGHSTQLYAQVGTFNLTIPSFTQVADVVFVVPKTTKP